MTTTPPASSEPPPDGPVPMPVPAASRVVVTGPNRWKVGVVLTAIFLCGALVGGLGTLRFLQKGARRHLDAAAWSASVMRDLDNRLHFTPAQRERIAPLMRAGAEEARLARRRAFGEARGIIDRTHAQVAAELDERQRPELERFLAERSRRARRWLGPGPIGDGPPGPPPARPRP